MTAAVKLFTSRPHTQQQARHLFVIFQYLKPGKMFALHTLLVQQVSGINIWHQDESKYFFK